MADGLWTLRDDGTFVLAEPYASQLMEAKAISTQAWANALIAYLAERSPYTEEELAAELLKRNKREEGKTVIFDEFVLEALSGDL